MEFTRIFTLQGLRVATHVFSHVFSIRKCRDYDCDQISSLSWLVQSNFFFIY